MFELMARGCMRVGEVQKLTPKDIEDRKAIIRDPKVDRQSSWVMQPMAGLSTAALVRLFQRTCSLIIQKLYRYP